jgi:hypothetical protein
MQNQGSLNLMSSFEFISILMSIVVGLGVTNLLSGVGRAFYRRKQVPMDEVHIVLTLATLLVLSLNWWVAFKWNTTTVWSFDTFLVLIAWTIALYMLTTFLYPPDLSEEEERGNRFDQNRSGYYTAFIVFCAMDITQTAMRGGLFQPLWYLPFVVQYAILAAAGLCVRKRGFDRFFAWYQLITLLVWSLAVRRYLVSDSIST